MRIPWPLTDGRVTVRPAEEADAAAFLNYKRRPECQVFTGRGVASAATALLVTALHRAGIRRVVAKAFAENVASIRVLTKNGFRLEGTERLAVLGRDGRWLDDCTLAHLTE